MRGGHRPRGLSNSPVVSVARAFAFRLKRLEGLPSSCKSRGGTLPPLPRRRIHPDAARRASAATPAGPGSERYRPLEQHW